MGVLAMTAGEVGDWVWQPVMAPLLVAALVGLGTGFMRWRAARKITWEARAKDEKMMVLRNTSSRTATNVVVVDPDDGWHVKGLAASLASIGPDCGVDVFWKDPGRKRRPNQVLVSCDEQKTPEAVPITW